MKKLFLILPITLLLFFSALNTQVIAQEPPPGTFQDGNQVIERGGIEFEGQAREFVPLTSVPGLTGTGDNQNRTLVDYLNVVFRFAIGVGALAAVLRITFAGIMYMTSEASVANKGKAREMITNSVLGLLLLLSVVVILQLINPNILNLNFLGNAQRLQIPVASQPPEEEVDEELCRFSDGDLISQEEAVQRCSDGIDIVQSGTTKPSCECKKESVPVEDVSQDENISEENQTIISQIQSNTRAQLAQSPAIDAAVNSVKNGGGEGKVLFSIKKDHINAQLLNNNNFLEEIDNACTEAGGVLKEINSTIRSRSGSVCVK